MGLFGNNDRLNTARYNLEQYEKTKPADYQSKYQGQIKDVMSKLENMGDFDYDPDADAAYQQYKNQYTRQAKLANQNAQANAVFVGQPPAQLPHTGQATQAAVKYADGAVIHAAFPSFPAQVRSGDRSGRARECPRAP